MHVTNRNCTFPVKREVYFENISLHVTSVNWHVVCKHPKQMQEGIPVCHILMCVATDDIWQIGIRACRRWHNSWPLLPLVWCVWVLMHRHESGINLQFTLSKKQTSIFPIMLNYSFNSWLLWMLIDCKKCMNGLQAVIMSVRLNLFSQRCLRRLGDIIWTGSAAHYRDWQRRQRRETETAAAAAAAAPG